MLTHRVPLLLKNNESKGLLDSSLCRAHLHRRDNRINHNKYFLSLCDIPNYPKAVRRQSSMNNPNRDRILSSFRIEKYDKIIHRLRRKP
jgi:hypothetical protein